MTDKLLYLVKYFSKGNDYNFNSISLIRASSEKKVKEYVEDYLLHDGDGETYKVVPFYESEIIEVED
jgi:acyl-CoA synthetase (NDP forming)